MEPELLKMEEVAARLGLSRSKTYELAATGALPTVVIGRRSIRVPRTALAAWLRDLPGHGKRSGEAVDAPMDAGTPTEAA